MPIAKSTIDERRVSVADFWPPPAVFLDLSQADIIRSEQAYCTGVAICNDEGQPTLSFFQGHTARIYCEFEIVQSIAVPGGGVEIRDALGHLIHGKNSFQRGTPAPHSVQPGARVRFQHAIRLDLGSGEYSVSVGLATTSLEYEQRYWDGTITDEAFRRTIQQLCRVLHIASLRVEIDPSSRLLHHGVANLPGDSQVRIVTPPEPAVSAESHRWSIRHLFARGRQHNTSRDSFGSKVSRPDIVHTPDTNRFPAVFHITHWKAGSQWINKILVSCVPDHIVMPEAGERQFLYSPLQPGKIYPTVYITAEQFASVPLPPSWRRFVIIRDLRDTLISAYFSLKISHPDDVYNAEVKERLQTLSMDAGLVMLMDEWLPACARIQLSWHEAGEQLIRYEDLLEHDEKIMERLLLEECQLPVEPTRLREVIEANRFERLTEGRARGQEHVGAHERKGIAGDWRNHFSDAIKSRFKNRFGAVLIATGYEHDLSW